MKKFASADFARLLWSCALTQPRAAHYARLGQLELWMAMEAGHDLMRESRSWL